MNVGAHERNVWLVWVLSGTVAGLLALAISAGLVAAGFAVQTAATGVAG